MPAEHPAPLPLGLENWFDESKPWDSGFISLMRTLAARSPELPAPGTSALPDNENFIIGQSPHMVFAPREIESVSQQDDKTHLKLFSLGIWGPQGAMPLHQTEMAYIRNEQHDTTLTNFVDLFHHRALSKLYRAWAVSQDTAALDRPHEERFSFYTGSLMGIDPQELAESVLPQHPRLSAASHLVREARNPEGLLGALNYYFGLPVQIREYVGQWITLQRDDQTQLGFGQESALLGDGAMLGDTVLDRQHKFQLIFGPLTLKQYIRFSPWGQDLPVLCEWIRQFVGFEYAWEVSLVLNASDVPCATLGDAYQLGYTSWLERENHDSPLPGMSFEPETYHNAS
ncbi:type VI secretion system baseplate subunit TssG [Pantoea sp. NPDC088449]|uniref:Type VI secretion system protein ImpH n=1 Tax=Candidatus Pantoea floridensis TaxID=1938870 RepID=A0A286BQA6_9GAMM|nr:type VI secretion system baseplate subunit TssG [Pantoea floridensis]PIF22982.1 type VI secretion system protein ImpH [Enterobacteriaceae bacterium JKS000233]SOD36336.1 type VI secretion system protein ImpH [Pantoea floridensis]HBZ14768.1 type VI secretion system baseplate subunit TssG [Pantoea sp.]